MNDLSLLSPKERKVYECIPLGSAHPISQENLAKSAETSGRSIAEIVQTLRRKGFLIGSSRSYPSSSGYYIISTDSEYYSTLGMLVASRNNFDKTIKAMMKRYTEHSFDQSAQKKPTAGQLDLLENLN